MAKYSDPYLEFVLCNFLKCAHTHSNEQTHTVNTHPEQWTAIYAAAPGEQLGLRCLAQGLLSRGIEDERALYIHPHLQLLPAWDSNSQPLDYESDSLTIGPWLPPYRLTSCMSYLNVKGELKFTQAKAILKKKRLNRKNISFLRDTFLIQYHKELSAKTNWAMFIFTDKVIWYNMMVSHGLPVPSLIMCYVLT